MAKVLFIKANPNAEEQSFSLSVGQAFMKAYRANHPQDDIIELDLYAMDIPLIDAHVMGAWGILRTGGAFDTLIAEQRERVSAIDRLTEQFVSADKYIFVTPMWNFSVPPIMKAYIDTVVIAGKTFRYTEQGPLGLMGGKRGIHIQARGGIYSGPMAAFEFGDSYIKAVMGFLGIHMHDSIIAEGMAYDPGKAEDIKQTAIAAAQEAARHF